MRLGILAVLGNHDVDTGAAHIIDVLHSHAIPVLRNRSVSLVREGKRLWLAGVDDVLQGTPDLEQALEGIPPAEPVVLLAHEPDWADDVARYPVDLQLSGHSHGGQICLPLIGAPYLPELGRSILEDCDASAPWPCTPILVLERSGFRCVLTAPRRLRRSPFGPGRSPGQQIYFSQCETRVILILCLHLSAPTNFGIHCQHHLDQSPLSISPPP